MNCEVIRDMIHSYVDGDLEAAQAAQVREHLAACHACQRVTEQLRALSMALAQKPEVEPSADFSARVRERLLREGPFVTPPREVKRWVWMEAASIALVAAVVACLAWWLVGVPSLTNWSSGLTFVADSAQGVVTFGRSLPDVLTAFIESGRSALRDIFLSRDALFPVQVQTFLWLGLGIAIIWNVWLQWRGGQARTQTLLRGE